jgi:hypothetical protein
MKSGSTRRPRSARLLRTVTRGLSRRRKGSRGKAPGAQQPPPRRLDVPLGNRVRTPVPPKMAVVMFVVVGLPAEAVARAVAEVASLQVMLSSFRPVFVTDCDQFQVFRRHGYLFEYIPPQQDWSSRFGESDWSSYLRERMDLLLERYEPDRVIGFDDVERFTLMRTGILDALVAPPSVPTAEHVAFVGPFPTTRLGRLMKRTAEIYVQSQRVDPKQLIRLARRYVRRRVRSLPRPR